ncbi:MAG: metallophosphoesterase family protein [Steroidobacteraceae bacterium]
MRTASIALFVSTIAFCAPSVATTFSVPDSQLPIPLVLIAYGDTRFTDVRETAATNPVVRRALVAKIAQERPAALFINGDLPWHGMAADYDAYRTETRQWREQRLRIYPALGNHEFAACWEPECLKRWWSEFPQLSGRRWYSVALGSRVLALALDSDASLLAGSEQRVWLEGELGAQSPTIRLVLIVMHHPPVADVQTDKMTDHNPRPNEQALADYLGAIAPQSHARTVVIGGHIHNYERFLRNGILYLVSGGGGATPYQVDRTPADLYQDTDFPNYHYLRFELRADTLAGEMIRYAQATAAGGGEWQIKDRFELTLPP